MHAVKVKYQLRVGIKTHLNKFVNPKGFYLHGFDNFEPYA